MIKAEIIADSLHPTGASRLTTFLLTYPRFVHAEFMTHRMFSRNASSSRAIPVKKQIQAVIDNPAIPIAFLKNKAGMQGGDPLPDESSFLAKQTWLKTRDAVVSYAYQLSDLEVHKQYANRILEPWAHITVVCTATDYANFFALRIHPMAMPEMQELAGQMYSAMEANAPVRRTLDDWHLPFVSDLERDTLNLDEQVKCSVARCARVSYLNHEGKAPSLEEDLALYDRLVGAHPIHASPAEHQATVYLLEYTANFYGFRSHRSLLANENIREFTR